MAKVNGLFMDWLDSLTEDEREQWENRQTEPNDMEIHNDQNAR